MNVYLIRHAHAGDRGSGPRDKYRPLSDKGHRRAAELADMLGGVGITLRDLAKLYAALGDDGVAKPLAWTEADAERVRRTRGVRLLRPEAADQVLGILRETPPPAGATPAALTRGRPLMAYKTGTSFGYRDAWAAGFDRRITVAVWVGRPDGAAVPGLVGRLVAAPILFDAFGRYGGEPVPVARPEGVLSARTFSSVQPPSEDWKAPSTM